MAKMELTRDQIKKFVEIYEHFHEIKCFTVEHTEDGEFLITFNLNDVELVKDQTNEQFVKQFVLDSKLN
jgi:hypothetical protein